MAKAIKLYLKAGELGCAPGYYNLGCSYQYGGNGVEADKEMTKYYWELAAMNRDVTARHNLGGLEVAAGNEHRALKHYILSARTGYKLSLTRVWQS
jgi:TPR repeat protein